MPLTADEKTALREEADRQGVDPDAFIAAAEEADADSEDVDVEDVEDDAPADDKAPAKAAPTDAKFFMWHKPFVRVRELRASLGLAERLDDDDLTCTDFEAKHGVTPSAASPAASTTAEPQ